MSQAATSSEITLYRRMFAEKYAELDELLADLPDAALLWKPFEQSPWQGPSNTLGEIIAHAVSSAIYLLRRAEYSLGRRAWETVDGDEGREEFGPANHAVNYLHARVRRTHAMVNEILDSLTPADLEISRAHPNRPREFSVRYDVVHAFEHLAQHIGHAQLTRQLWALQATQATANA
jgi:hypothetical protein